VALPKGGAVPGGRYEAVLFDALGTLVELESPWPLLETALSAYGIDIGAEDARHAMLAEMSYYRAHHMEGRDDSSLAELRARCAEVLRENLPPAAHSLPADALREALMHSIRFRPYPDAAPALGRLRLLGFRSAVVSNWDVSLRGILGEIGLGGLVDDVVVSAEVGVAKPAPAIFELALRRLHCPADRAVLVGDSPETDIAGARRAGVRAVLIDRAAAAQVDDDAHRIFTLDNLEDVLS
jgi:putative hydrolase of the HAD superfamily